MLLESTWSPVPSARSASCCRHKRGSLLVRGEKTEAWTRTVRHGTMSDACQETMLLQRAVFSGSHPCQLLARNGSGVTIQRGISWEWLLLILGSSPQNAALFDWGMRLNERERTKVFVIRARPVAVVCFAVIRGTCSV